MRRVLRTILAGALILATDVVLPHSALAVTTGTGNCVATVSTTSGVTTIASGNFCYYVFVTSSSTYTWTVPYGITSLDALIIAGGGAGGAGAWGGGGGAGELVYYSGYAVTSGSSISLRIGAGGTSGTASLDPTVSRSNPGSDSWIGSASGVVAKGGGEGASYGYNSATSYTTGGNGGSGGGGSEQATATAGGSSTASSSGSRTGYGTAGGYGGSSTYKSGGGGGGSGTSGSNGTNGGGGTGGNGTTTYSSWLTVIRSSMAAGWQTATTSGYIAAGGGGGGYTTAGSPGSGGGGTGATTSTLNGTAGVANTGSGGGGASYNGSAQVGGAGGSGLVILRTTLDSTAPTFSNSATANSNENVSTSTNLITISVSESSTIQITSGADSLTVTLIVSDTKTAYIRWILSPDYEAPTDVGANNVYNFTVSATDSFGNVGTQNIAITVLNVSESTSLGSLIVASTAYKGLAVLISITSNNPGVFRFFANGKRIPGCLNKATTGNYPNVTATCTWEPSVMGNQVLSATFTPTDNSFTTVSASRNIWVYKRATNR